MVRDKQEQNNGTSNAHRQAKYIDAGIKFLLVKIPPGDFEIVVDHDAIIEDLIFVNLTCNL